MQELAAIQAGVDVVHGYPGIHALEADVQVQAQHVGLAVDLGELLVVTLAEVIGQGGIGAARKRLLERKARVQCQRVIPLAGAHIHLFHGDVAVVFYADSDFR